MAATGDPSGADQKPVSIKRFNIFASVFTADQGLGSFFGLLVALLFVIYPLVEFTNRGRTALDIFFSLLLIRGAFTIRKGVVLKSLILSMVAITFSVYWIKRFVPGLPLYRAQAALSMICLGLFIAVILFHVFQPGPMTLHRVMGVVSVYLLLGLVWAFAYHLVQYAIPDAFHFSFTPLGEETMMARLVYFSFETLTTVGFGDITAVHPIARALVVSEALVGQLFPVLLIGGLLSMALQSRDQV
jgi:hypothetical protein